jgi:hypothetical protein
VKPAVLASAVLAIMAANLGCGAPASPPTAQAGLDEPRWEDVIDTTPELLAVIQPAALRKDPVYGPLLRRVIELVRARSRVVAETRALDAMEDADEVIVGVRPDVDGAEGEVIVVVRGVRADIDPATLVDGDGQRLWAPGPSGRVTELVRSGGDATPSMGQAPVESIHPGAAVAASSPVPASLFELPGRTWVIASGAARARARAAFARPLGHGPLRFEGFDPSGPLEGPLAVVRIDGPALVGHIRALQPLGALGAVGHRLQALTLELAAGAGADEGARPDAGVARNVQTSLDYSTDDAAALAEASVREVVATITRKRPDDLAWLASASVERPTSGKPPTSGKTVVVSAPLPPRLVAALLHASAATLEDSPTSSP